MRFNAAEAQVLIETYWNVNIYTREIYYDNDGVLIETYWNVNENDLVFLKNSFSY